MQNFCSNPRRLLQHGQYFQKTGFIKLVVLGAELDLTSTSPHNFLLKKMLAAIRMNEQTTIVVPLEKFIHRSMEVWFTQLKNYYRGLPLLIMGERAWSAVGKEQNVSKTWQDALGRDFSIGGVEHCLITYHPRTLCARGALKRPAWKHLQELALFF